MHFWQQLNIFHSDCSTSGRLQKQNIYIQLTINNAIYLGCQGNVGSQTGTGQTIKNGPTFIFFIYFGIQMVFLSVILCHFIFLERIVELMLKSLAFISEKMAS